MNKKKHLYTDKIIYILLKSYIEHNNIINSKAINYFYNLQNIY